MPTNVHKKKSISQDAILLFDLKEMFIEKISEVEKEIFEQNSKIHQLEEILVKMNSVAKKSGSIYFQKRISKVISLMKTFLSKKGYDKKEFDLIFHSIGKIKKTDSIELLDDSLKNRLDKISEIHFKQEQFDSGKKVVYKCKYLTFRFQSVNFIVENAPKKIIRNVEKSKTKCRIEGKAYPIYPSQGFGLDSDERIFDEFCDLLILKTESGYRCFHVDEMGLSVQFSEETFQKMLKSTEKPLNFIKNYIKWKNQRYYYIPNGV